MNNFFKLLAALSLAILSSCSSHKDFVYLKDIQPGVDYAADLKHEAVIHANDRLSISVSSKNPELALPFNQAGGNFRLSADGSVTASDDAASSSSREKGYRVDVQGDINFPLLGKLHLEGLTLNQATELIRTRIMEGNYIKDPLVTVEFLNFKYTVLGAVGRVGSYTAQGDRVTILEALAQAGDLLPKARLDRIRVIREEGGVRREYVQDIRNKSIFDSPAFYLQQNDVVYVEPKYDKRDREDRTWQFTTFFVSLAGVATSLIWALTK